MRTPLFALLISIPALATADQLSLAGGPDNPVPADAILCGFRGDQLVCWAEPDATPTRAYACDGMDEDLRCWETKASTFRPLFAFCEVDPDAGFQSLCD